MNQYPPGDYIGTTMGKLPPPGPDLPPQTVVIDAGRLWGRYRVVFIARRNPRQRMGDLCFWALSSGERIKLPK